MYTGALPACAWQLPDSLELLIPGQLEALQSDDIGGQQLRYLRPGRAAGNLYSVGLNGIDDGGYPEKWKTPEGKERGDWCWVQLRE